MQPLTITHEQARKAFTIIYMIIDDAFPEGDRPMATQINLHPSVVKDMRELVEEARQNDERN